MRIYIEREKERERDWIIKIGKKKRTVAALEGGSKKLRDNWSKRDTKYRFHIG